MNSPTNKLSIYLIKEQYSNDKDILRNYNTLKSKKISDTGTLYYGHSKNYKPSWLGSFFGSEFTDLEIFGSTAKAILITEVQVDNQLNRIFAIPFGYGYTLLTPGVYEERFGLKTVLNIIDPNTLRKIDKKNMSAVPKDTSEQLSRAGIAADFGIDIEQDLIRSITAGSEEIRFGKTVTGKDSLAISTKIDISNIKEFLRECYQKFTSDKYKEYFGWIDQIAEIKDKTLLQNLENRLLNNIKTEKFDKTWMAVPELVQWEEIEGFTYRKSMKEEKKSDIDLPDFLHSLSEIEKSDLDINILKRKNIYCYSSLNEEITQYWKAINCLYCEIFEEIENKTYILSNGKWYEIENEFSSQVNSDYKQLFAKVPSCQLPHYDHNNENAYNSDVATKKNEFCCLDGQNINHGGGYSKIEFCDLYAENKIIHVKRYGGSSVLSHLFNQGVVSGELFLADENFREKVNNILPKDRKFSDHRIKPIPANYEIVYGIISSSPGEELEIPFFSKVSLRNAKRRLETFGYKVFIKKICSNSLK